jgi:hypothetical protein
MKIQPIVEGRGEVEAFPVLLRRLQELTSEWQFSIARPIRQNSSIIRQELNFKKAIKLARIQEDCGGILVLFDLEDDCPADIGSQLQQWADDLSLDVPCCVVLAYREYETWFLAGIESLRGYRNIRDNAERIDNPEQYRDSKGQLEKRMVPGCYYRETLDQTPLSAQVDIKHVAVRSRSFKKLISCFSSILSEMGYEDASEILFRFLDAV